MRINFPLNNFTVQMRSNSYSLNICNLVVIPLVTQLCDFFYYCVRALKTHKRACLCECTTPKSTCSFSGYLGHLLYVDICPCKPIFLTVVVRCTLLCFFTKSYFPFTHFTDASMLTYVNFSKNNWKPAVRLFLHMHSM